MQKVEHCNTNTKQKFSCDRLFTLLHLLLFVIQLFYINPRSKLTIQVYNYTFKYSSFWCEGFFSHPIFTTLLSHKASTIWLILFRIFIITNVIIRPTSLTYFVILNDLAKWQHGLIILKSANEHHLGMMKVDCFDKKQLIFNKKWDWD